MYFHTHYCSDHRRRSSKLAGPVPTKSCTSLVTVHPQTAKANQDQTAFVEETTLIPVITKAEILRIVEDFPVGYPRLAAFADSDESFMLYRRFGYLHSRLLLHLQDELRELEDNLYDMDKRDEDDEEGRRCLQSRDLDVDREPAADRESRGALLQRIEQKALQYGMYWI
jgi:hypothetical protein